MRKQFIWRVVLSRPDGNMVEVEYPCYWTPHKEHVDKDPNGGVSRVANACAAQMTALEKKQYTPISASCAA
jgi:hypothetical protein